MNFPIYLQIVRNNRYLTSMSNYVNIMDILEVHECNSKDFISLTEEARKKWGDDVYSLIFTRSLKPAEDINAHK